MLTEQEFQNIFSWLPYRQEWPVDRNRFDNNIQDYYGILISALLNNLYFETYESQDGGMSNYLEFICYPKSGPLYDGNAIMICISLCAPIATYGQVRITKAADSFGWNFLEVGSIQNISDPQLKEIEKEVRNILLTHNLKLIEREYAVIPLPKELIENNNNVAKINL